MLERFLSKIYIWACVNFPICRDLSPFGNLSRGVFFSVDLFFRRGRPMNITGAVAGKPSIPSHKNCAVLNCFKHTCAVKKHYGASFKTSRLRLDFPVIPLPWFSDFLSFCRRASHTRQCECVLRPELKYGIFSVQTQGKGRWKAELRYVFEFVSMFVVNLRSTSIVLTSWIEEGQVLIGEHHWNGQWILKPLMDACKWNFQEMLYCDNGKWLIKQLFSCAAVRKRVRQWGIL